MQTMKFFARGKSLVGDVDNPTRTGVPREFVGRTFDADTKGYPATEEAYATVFGTKQGNRCMKCCQQGDLWAADQETASLCGVPFVEVQFAEGAWVAKPSAPKAATDEAAGAGANALAEAPSTAAPTDASARAVGDEVSPQPTADAPSSAAANDGLPVTEPATAPSNPKGRKAH